MIGRFYNWISTWHGSSRRKESTSSVFPSSSSNCSNMSCESTLLNVKGDKLTTILKHGGSHKKKTVSFAATTEVFNINKQQGIEELCPLDETVEEVYVKDGVIRGFIKVSNLEPGRQVLVRVTDDHWGGFIQVRPQRVEKITDSKGQLQIRRIKEKRGKFPRRRKQIKPSTELDTTIGNQETTYLFKVKVDQTKLNQVELVVVSSLDNVIDTNHQQCYMFKSLRRSWEANESPSPRQWDVNRGTNSRQS